MGVKAGGSFVNRLGSSGRALNLVAIISLLLISVIAYWRVLRDGFAGVDDLTLIETSRIGSFDDFIRLFTTPTGNYAFTQHFNRPISSLTYTFDYAIWGLNPFGYHLTDLALHLVVVILVFLLSRT